MKIFEDSFERKLIYIFSLDYETHKGLLKIGETTLKTYLSSEELLPNCEILNQAARKRILQYTNTAGIKFNLLHTEIAADFRDYDVHRILINSNVEKKSPEDSTGREWFEVSLQKAIAAIQAAKLKRNNISGVVLKKFFHEVEFRPEQKDAVNKTVKAFKSSNKFLWNAKMRFGKTLCSLKVVEKMNFAKTIIVTHRPVVGKGWFDDFIKIFHNKNFLYGSKTKGNDIKNLLASGKNFVYFASIQDLRGSEIVGGNFIKNKEIFATDWDFVIVDEAHEGTQTILGDSVIKNLVKENSKFLALSGTPFNILEDYSDNVFTWDYVNEQRAKKTFAEKNFCDSNPYADLPEMKIYTYNLGEILKNNSYLDVDDKAFNFREFFNTKDDNFIHSDDVKKFLDLLTEKNQNSFYPFANEDFRNYFRHSLWILPGVKESKALSKILKNHSVFGNFEIVNVAGDGDDGNNFDALKKVESAIKNFNYTITISCGRLTMGVTVPEWTAVFMLAGSYSTSAASYLQTIFRVQSPCNFGDKIKKFCYVFDFAPDRTLKMIAQSVKISAQAGKTSDNDRFILGEFLNFCPVISIHGSQMKFYNTDNLFRQLKRSYVNRVVKNGFDDVNLYNNQLFKLDDFDLQEFNELQKIIGKSNKKNPSTLEINRQGFTDEKFSVIDKKPKRKLSDDEKILQKQKNLRAKAISILRQISIRLPLLIYGSDIPLDENFNIEMFCDENFIDNASWLEFMPKGVDRQRFKKFIKFYDRDIFVAAAQEIRNRAKLADNFNPTERIIKIAQLFATFRNPDKETVLTSWRVVNLHVNSAFGGYNFFADDSPKFSDSEIFTNINSKILDINSKTGLYPLLAAYNFYRLRLGNFSEEDFTPVFQQKTWNLTLQENIFVICKTPMAEKISRRTLAGFKNSHVNILRIENFVDLIKNNFDSVLSQIKNKNFWNLGDGTLNFDAVIGNPPYQKSQYGDNKTFATPVYHEFLKAAWKLSDKVSLIHPARCLFNAGATPSDFNEKFLSDEHIKILNYFPVSSELFPNTDIKGGVVITLRDADKIFAPIGTFIPFPELNSIHKKVVLDNENFQPLSKIIFSRKIYKLTEKFYKENPNAPTYLKDDNSYTIGSNAFEKMDEYFFDNPPDTDCIKILGFIEQTRTYKFIRRDYVNNPEPLEKFKVLVPKVNGSGAIGEVLSTPLVGLPLVGLPLVGSTETFITVGAFDTAEESAACIAYIKTKFCRAMLGILKVTQDNTPQTWAKVPLQDFTKSSDIDWSKSISEIDKQLYAKYKLSDEEINFIESKVREMK